MNPRLAAAVATLALAACGSHTTSPAASTPPPAPKPAPARTAPAPEVTRLVPGAAHYLLQTRVHIDQDFAGMPPVIELGYRIFLSTAVTGPADSGGWPASFTIDSILGDSGMTMLPGVNLAAARGYKITGRVRGNGEFVNGVPSDSGLAQSLGQMLPRFRNFYPRVPKSGVKPGETWSDTTTASETTTGGSITTTSITHRAALPWSTKDGSRVLPVVDTSTFDFNGSGEGNGTPFTVAGTGAGVATQFIGSDGRYVGAVSRDSSKLDIGIPTQGMTIPRRQIAKTTLTLLSQ